MNLENKKARPWNIFDSRIDDVPKAVWNNRFEICKSCEWFLKSTGQCKKCGCFMQMKCKLPHAECPVGKWNKYVDEDKYFGG